MAKKWTILVYANGNNEFEPEMYRLLLDCQNIMPSEDINILVQIGREKRELVKILRPESNLENDHESWIGVRRYYLKVDNFNKGLQADLVKDQGIINMAHPKVLYDFLEWGVKSYPAEKYMVIMGGHSFQYLGIMTDYSGKLPYIMGIPELAKALNLVKRNTGKSLDILVLDTCYMNMVEILYELAKEKNHFVKNVLTYIEYGPLEGLPLSKLINIIIENIDENEINELLARIIDELNFDLIAFHLNRKKLEKVRRQANGLAEIFLNRQDKNYSLADVWMNCDGDPFWVTDINNLKKGLNELIIYSKRVTNYESNLLDIAYKKTTNKLAAYYTRLSFTKDNKWTKLLDVEQFKKGLFLEEKVQMKPLVLPLQALVSLISVMNPHANEQETENILRNLLKYKKWEKFSNVKLKEQ